MNRVVLALGLWVGIIILLIGCSEPMEGYPDVRIERVAGASDEEQGFTVFQVTNASPFTLHYRSVDADGYPVIKIYYRIKGGLVKDIVDATSLSPTIMRKLPSGTAFTFSVKMLKQPFDDWRIAMDFYAKVGFGQRRSAQYRTSFFTAWNWAADATSPWIQKNGLPSLIGIQYQERPGTYPPSPLEPQQPSGTEDVSDAGSD